MKQAPTKNQYEAALQTVKEYENRQKQLQYVKDQLSTKLLEFKQIKFRVDKKKGEVIFSGLHKGQNKLLLGTSTLSYGDIFEESIGKLIAVKKSLGEDVKKIVELVESKQFIGINLNGASPSLVERLNNAVITNVK